jgi:hypothetical protein
LGTGEYCLGDPQPTPTFFRVQCIGAEGDTLPREFDAFGGQTVEVRVVAEISLFNAFSTGSANLVVTLTPQ